MKYKGEKRIPVNVRYLVLPRPAIQKEGESVDQNFYFTAQAVTDFSEFHALVKRPVPLKKKIPGGQFEDDFSAPEYKIALSQYEQKYSDWTALKSLEPTKDLEWELVKMDQPDTWLNWQKEILDSGILQSEFARIIQIVNEANGFDDKVYNEALESFLADRRQ